MGHVPLHCPAEDRYWADPFIVTRENQTHIFIEEKMYATGRGRIACLTLDDHGNLQSHQVVLERPYHLSYPFIFEHRGETFMLPETAQNRTLEIYHCARFPDQWELAAVLMNDVTRWTRLYFNVKTNGGYCEC